MNKITLASGILPVAADTKELCMAWRSPQVKDGDCFAVIGGLLKENLVDLADNAVEELVEEMGFIGAIQLHPAFLFKKPGFHYQNYIGVVATPFQFNPQPEYAFETSFIEWWSYGKVMIHMADNPRIFHKGLLALLKESRSLIESLL